MYTGEQRQRAIDTFIRLGHSYAATVRELGYPSEVCLRNWWKDYERTGQVDECKLHRKSKYDEEKRLRAIEHYLEHGKSMSRTIRALGYPGSRSYLAKWIVELAPGERRVIAHSSRREPRSIATMVAGVAALKAREGTAEKAAEGFGATRADLYRWRRQILGHNGGEAKERRRPVSKPYDNLPDDIEELRAMEEDLKMQVRELQLEIDVLRTTREVIKKTRAPTRNG